MKRILPFLLAAPIAVYAFACSSSDSNTTDTNNADGGTSNPTGTIDPTGDATAPGDPNVNPTTGVTLSEFSNPGAAVHGMTWVPSEKAFYVALPTSTAPFFQMPDTTVGKLVRIDADGTTSYEILAGTTTTGAIFSAAFNAKLNKVQVVGYHGVSTIAPNVKAVTAGTDFATTYTGLESDDAGTTATPLAGLNDIVLKKDGSGYMTAPYYPGASTTDVQPDNAFHRVYYIKLDGSTAAVAHYENNEAPNGIALSPDEKTLYVALTDPTTATPAPRLPVYGAYPAIWKYTINADGSLAAGTKFAQIGAALSSDLTTKPDGLVVDTAGNVYVATVQGVVVLKPSGEPWGTITATEQIASLAWGGDDLKTLYLGASNDPGAACDPRAKPTTPPCDPANNTGKIYKASMPIAGIAR